MPKSYRVIQRSQLTLKALLVHHSTQDFCCHFALPIASNRPLLWPLHGSVYHSQDAGLVRPSRLKWIGASYSSSCGYRFFQISRDHEASSFVGVLNLSCHS